MTTTAAWAAIKALFETCVDLAAPQREPLIAAADLDAASLAELRSLLAHHDDATGAQVFMAESAAQQLAEGASRLGQRLGAWQIVRAVGAGGMGEVFEARRADGSFDGRAAVKLLKRGMDSAAVLQRFAQERQALARLNHPHIARLLDAGASEDGLPYFVLEFVDGQPIDEAVRNLALEQRLQLFLQLADAVAHAHRNLLVHRDLKPGNVLVDSEGQVKLLDFGIAKALDPLEGHDGQTTVGGVRPYTPNYASPEQVRGEPVSTATDIYSLGVLLYQLLTGTRPTGRNATTPAEAARSVLEDEPTRPSRLSPAEAVDPQWLHTRKRLEGDLDNILLKALEKAPERRYTSVDALTADIKAYLQGHPVSARSASAAYVLSKFVRRHRWAVLAAGLGGLGLATGLAAALLQGRPAAALGALGLGAGLLMALVQSRQASLSRDLAHDRLQATRAIVGELMVRHADAVHGLPGGLGLKSALLVDMIRHLDGLAAQAGQDKAFIGELAQAHARLADVQGNVSGLSLEQTSHAQLHAAKALSFFAQAGETPANAQACRWWAKTHYTLGRLERAAGRPQEALAQFERGLAVLDAAPLKFRCDPDLRMATIGGLAECAQTLDATGMSQLNQPGPALDHARRAQELLQTLKAERNNPEDAFVLARIHNIQAVVHEKNGRLQQAHDDCERAAALMQENLQAQDKPDTTRQLTRVLVLHNLSHLRSGLGQHQAACEASAQAWTQLQQLMRENVVTDSMRQRAAIVQHGWAAALLEAGEPALALQQLPDVVAWHREQAARENDPQAVDAKRRWASALADQGRGLQQVGRLDEAETTALQAHALLAPLIQPGTQDRECLVAWADTLDLLAQLPQGARWRGEAMQAYKTLQALEPLDAIRSARLQSLQSAG